MTHTPSNKCCKCKSKKENPNDCYCKLCRAAYAKNWKLNNAIRNEENRKNYYEKNKLKWRERNRKEYAGYKRKREAIDADFKARNRLRTALYVAIKKESKKSFILKFLGCSIPELKKHLESQFKNGMTWDSYGKGDGKWSIDHIKPLKDFDLTKEQEIKDAMNYKNVRPMDYIENCLRHFNENKK